VTPEVVAFSGVSKNYGGLRPLRIAELRVRAGDRVALLGFDQPTAEVFVNLATGATLPDAGEVTLFGRPSTAISDSDDWLATVDRFGIVSERAVLLEQMTVVQNLAMPFTLDIEPPPDAERARAEALAREVGLDAPTWSTAVARLDAAAAMRVRLGRAIALDPHVLLLEHASAPVPRPAIHSLAADVAAVAQRRGMALVALTADEAFARALGGTVLTLEAATGRLARKRKGWFGLG
jgi:predicted ABC-type transport system involved in lysophospholipase L1 biosynthesis ATPase subunit